MLDLLLFSLGTQAKMNIDEQYQLATNAIKRKDYSQAISYFLELLKEEPDHIDSRRGLRAVQLNQAGGKFAATMGGAHLLAQIAFFKKKNNVEKGMEACEKFLCKDPKRTWVLQQLALFAAEKKYLKTARFCYENLVELNPEDIEKTIEAADFLSDLGEEDAYKKANLWMDYVVKLEPNDIELRSHQSRIATKKTLGTYEGAKTSQDIINVDSSAELEKESQAIRTKDDLLQAIDRAVERDQEEPDNARTKETVASLYFRGNMLKEALSFFKQALALDPANESLKNKLADTQIRAVQLQTENIKKRLETTSGEEKTQLQQKIKSGEKKHAEMRLTEFQRRLKVNPNDLSSRYELGCIFYAQGEMDRAIENFQKSVSDAKYSFKSAIYLGNSFKNKGLQDLAIVQFTEASRKPSINKNERLSAQYQVGICHMELEQMAEALDVLKKIIEKDFGFKDTAKKVEEIKNILKKSSN